MRGLLILALILVVTIFLLPFVLGFVVFILCALAIFMLLARFGLLPGTVFRSYTFSTTSKREERSGSGATIRFEEDAPAGSGGDSGWYQASQEGEIVTLPETALKKDPPQGNEPD